MRNCSHRRLRNHVCLGLFCFGFYYYYYYYGTKAEPEKHKICRVIQLEIKSLLIIYPVGPGPIHPDQSPYALQLEDFISPG